MMCCFLELDLGTMTAQQLKTKFRRYEVWALAPTGQQYLIDLYRVVFSEAASAGDEVADLSGWCGVKLRA